MATRHLFRREVFAYPFQRAWHPGSHMIRNCASSTNNSGSLVQIDVSDEYMDAGIAVLKMNRPPVNSFTSDFLREFVTSIRKLEDDPRCRGVILTSALPKVFSAGLDLTEFYQSNDRIRECWQHFYRLWVHLYGSRLVTVAAINGHAVAGGCAIAQFCDYRVMNSSPTLKLAINATEVGVPPPRWIAETVTKVVGHRESEKIWLSAKKFNPQSGLEVGLVDEICPGDDVIPRALQVAKRWLSVDDNARVLTKKLLRQSLLDKITPAVAEAEIDEKAAFLSRDDIQQIIGNYIAGISKRKK